jgi:hypothetical protein
MAATRSAGAKSQLTIITAYSKIEKRPASGLGQHGPRLTPLHAKNTAEQFGRSEELSDFQAE